MDRTRSRIVLFLLVKITKIKIAKTNTCFLTCFSLSECNIRYNKLFSHNFNI